ncbi:IS1634 family transposase [candidate division KSB1 bacterium]|nr:IS1634 family transposase [candidate division KSB1 bacterium]
MKTYLIDFVSFTSYLMSMYIRKITRKKDGKTHAYWALVESRRTERGPRQHVVAYLGEMDAAGRLGVRKAAEGRSDHQADLYEKLEPEWVEVNVRGVRTERVRDFGDIWLALELLKRLGLVAFFQQVMPAGREKIPWADLACILTIARFCEPKSELYIAEHFYGHTALADLMGIPNDLVYDNRLYRALDKLLPHKEALEKHLKQRFGELFNIEYDLLLYDVTSTYFEGEAASNSQAKRGYSRDQRPDCKQVCIALVVTKEGIPLGYEVFAGNRHDSTTVEEIVEKMETRYGAADRIWVMDRGMVSDENIDFLKQKGRRYIIGTPKSLLKKFERELLSGDWQKINEGLQVKKCASPDGTEETFILCRSAARKEKEQAMLERFTGRIEKELQKIQTSGQKGRLKNPAVAERRIGRLLERNSRAAGLFDIKVIKNQEDDTLSVTWSKSQDRQSWQQLTQGCYMLRSNIADWSAEDLWHAYIHLTDVEAAFRIQKNDLVLRPIWHQTEKRVQAHILVCFLAYVLWKCLSQMCKNSGLGNEPRKIIDEIKRIKLTDVILPTKKGVEIRLSCVSKPDDHQRILLQHLRLKIPARLTKNHKM